MHDNTAGRIRDDDELISPSETFALMGGISVSTAYEDIQLMELKIPMTAPGRRTKRICFIRREVLALRAQRVARAEASNQNARAQIEARIERRRTRQRLRAANKIET